MRGTGGRPSTRRGVARILRRNPLLSLAVALMAVSTLTSAAASVMAVRATREAHDAAAELAVHTEKREQESCAFFNQTRSDDITAHRRSFEQLAAVFDGDPVEEQRIIEEMVASLSELLPLRNCAGEAEQRSRERADR